MCAMHVRILGIIITYLLKYFVKIKWHFENIGAISLNRTSFVCILRIYCGLWMRSQTLFNRRQIVSTRKHCFWETGAAILGQRCSRLLQRNRDWNAMPSCKGIFCFFFSFETVTPALSVLPPFTQHLFQRFPGEGLHTALPSRTEWEISVDKFVSLLVLVKHKRRASTQIRPNLIYDNLFPSSPKVEKCIC